MKLLIDLFPVILFFVAFKLKGIFVATLVAMIASVLQITYAYFKYKKVDPMMWLSLGIIGVFGGATLILHNETFIKWKPTVLYGSFAIVMIGGQLLFKKNAIQGILGKQIVLPAKTWKTLNLSWGAFFILLAAVNLFVAYTFSTDVWVNFKLFGIMGLILAFVFIQSILLGSKIQQVNKE